MIPPLYAVYCFCQTNKQIWQHQIVCRELLNFDTDIQKVYDDLIQGSLKVLHAAF